MMFSKPGKFSLTPELYIDQCFSNFQLKNSRRPEPHTASSWCLRVVEGGCSNALCPQDLLFSIKKKKSHRFYTPTLGLGAWVTPACQHGCRSRVRLLSNPISSGLSSLGFEVTCVTERREPLTSYLEQCKSPDCAQLDFRSFLKYKRIHWSQVKCYWLLGGQRRYQREEVTLAEEEDW